MDPRSNAISGSEEGDDRCLDARLKSLLGLGAFSILDNIMLNNACFKRPLKKVVDRRERNVVVELWSKP